jgi:hypothetical protein
VRYPSDDDVERRNSCPRYRPSREDLRGKFSRRGDAGTDHRSGRARNTRGIVKQAVSRFPLRFRQWQRQSVRQSHPREQRLARLDAVAKLLDIAFIVPGTKIRYGIDGIIGLIPVVGDIIATALSLWLVREARALGAPWHVTARMLGNVAIQGVVGTVPVAGDAFDVLFRANIRNVRLLRRWMDKQPR